MADKWFTSITDVGPNKIRLSGYPIGELMGRKSFAEVVWLTLRGELPSEAEGKLLDAVLVSSVDHGVTPPSTLAARTAASTGAPVNAALASGVLAVNRFHGGAVEGCMAALAEAVAHMKEKDVSREEAAAATIGRYGEGGRRVEGFGHRLHDDDPRAARLFALAEELGLAAEGIPMARAFETALRNLAGKGLPLNVDGAIGACLFDLGFEPHTANAFFILARMPGWLAHVVEEQTRERPMRRIEPSAWAYDGPGERHLT
ncbi:MAG: citryl-CoA lyase [candidate division Zixibacteria bacterium]|nr:citryl-CoA lyase [candidate division Zixibacteria bacterium]